MAHTSWNEIDSIKYEFGNHICAFLDILGYKEKSKDFFSGKFNLYGRINRALLQAGVEKNRDDSPDDIFTQIFSDSIIVQTKEENLDLLLNYIAVLVTYFSYEELYLRGGVSVGKYIDEFEPNNNYSFFSSEALIKAYKLETKAIYPLIEIDPRLVKKIHTPNIVVKFNGKNILNFVRYIINENGANEDNVVAELKDIETILKNNENSDIAEKEKVAEKMKWIISYYLWFVKMSNEKCNNFDMENFTPFEKYINKKFVFEE